jgi:hypothetical protein
MPDYACQWKSTLHSHATNVTTRKTMHLTPCTLKPSTQPAGYYKPGCNTVTQQLAFLHSGWGQDIIQTRITPCIPRHLHCCQDSGTGPHSDGHHEVTGVMLHTCGACCTACPDTRALWVVFQSETFAKQLWCWICCSILNRDCVGPGSLGSDVNPPSR